MLSRNFIDYSIKLLLKDKTEYFFSFIIFTFIVFILSTVLFISDSIKYDLLSTLGNQDQIIVTNTKSGKYFPLNENHINTILQLDGVENVQGKVDGYYNFSQSSRLIHLIADDSLSDDEIIVSKDIKLLFKIFHYDKEFNFLTLDGTLTKKIKSVIASNILSSNTIFANSDVSREILQMNDEQYSYLSVYVPNDNEVEFLARKIMDIFPNTIAISKTQLQSYYRQIFYYKGGIFMILYIVAMLTFFILLKNQVSSVLTEQKKQIAILRSIGFSIKDIISLKFIQNSVIALSSYFIGVLTSYIFVFIFDAPIVKNIFLGEQMENIIFTPTVDFRMHFLIFLFTIIPFLAFIIIPSWKVAIEDISEIMK
ncbi:ABC transporter permease [Malaciobacter marinus]|mgnify:CR=1 FL=1|jgi:ABC-type lipoprotein release transport system permease subunit|uniref:ABC transporter permease n=1 Tax=Malaciobacter marinus TaxID=505249 RepID=UPI0009A8D5F8|nr:FtsX-like permease family protein [Malaciobacter marinus]SKB42724.1 ABC-type transport system, involved in lipoprotein release, permease component [Malaciobacter marinus]